jgi:hypothetical protein
MRRLSAASMYIANLSRTVLHKIFSFDGFCVGEVVASISLVRPAYSLLNASANLLAPFNHTQRHLTTPRFPVSDKSLYWRKMLSEGRSVHQCSVARQQITILAALQQWECASPKCGELCRKLSNHEWCIWIDAKASVVRRSIVPAASNLLALHPRPPRIG